MSLIAGDLKMGINVEIMMIMMGLECANVGAVIFDPYAFSASAFLDNFGVKPLFCKSPTTWVTKM